MVAVIKPRAKAFKVGDRVTFRIGENDIMATVIEDRGNLGYGGRQIVGVEYSLDPPHHLFQAELASEDLEPAPRRRRAAVIKRPMRARARR